MFKRKSLWDKGKLRPSARANLRVLQRALDISSEQAKDVELEVLKPYREKAENIKLYEQTLTEEKEYGEPLSSDAIAELIDLKRQLNLLDEDLLELEGDLLKEDEIIASLEGKNIRENHEKSVTLLSLFKKTVSSFMIALPWLLGSWILFSIVVVNLSPYDSELISFLSAHKTANTPKIALAAKDITSERAERVRKISENVNAREEEEYLREIKGGRYLLLDVAAWILVGLISGVIARVLSFLYLESRGLGVLGTMLMGVIGGGGGGVMSVLFTPTYIFGLDASIIFAWCSSITLLSLYYVVTRRTT